MTTNETVKIDNLNSNETINVSRRSNRRGKGGTAVHDTITAITTVTNRRSQQGILEEGQIVLPSPPESSTAFIRSSRNTSPTTSQPLETTAQAFRDPDLTIRETIQMLMEDEAFARRFFLESPEAITSELTKMAMENAAFWRTFFLENPQAVSDESLEQIMKDGSFIRNFYANNPGAITSRISEYVDRIQRMSKSPLPLEKRPDSIAAIHGRVELEEDGKLLQSERASMEKEIAKLEGIVLDLRIELDATMKQNCTLRATETKLQKIVADYETQMAKIDGENQRLRGRVDILIGQMTREKARGERARRVNSEMSERMLESHGQTNAREEILQAQVLQLQNELDDIERERRGSEARMAVQVEEVAVLRGELHKIRRWLEMIHREELDEENHHWNTDHQMAETGIVTQESVRETSLEDELDDLKDEEDNVEVPDSPTMTQSPSSLTKIGMLPAIVMKNKETPTSEDALSRTTHDEANGAKRLQLKHEISILPRELEDTKKLLEDTQKDLKDRIEDFEQIMRANIELEKERGHIETTIDHLRERCELLETQLGDEKVKSEVLSQEDEVGKERPRSADSSAQIRNHSEPGIVDISTQTEKSSDFSMSGVSTQIQMIPTSFTASGGSQEEDFTIANSSGGKAKVKSTMVNTAMQTEDMSVLPSIETDEFYPRPPNGHPDAIWLKTESEDGDLLNRPENHSTPTSSEVVYDSTAPGPKAGGTTSPNPEPRDLEEYTDMEYTPNRETARQNNWLETNESYDPFPQGIETPDSSPLCHRASYDEEWIPPPPGWTEDMALLRPKFDYEGRPWSPSDGPDEAHPAWGALPGTWTYPTPQNRGQTSRQNSESVVSSSHSGSFGHNTGGSDAKFISQPGTCYPDGEDSGTWLTNGEVIQLPESLSSKKFSPNSDKSWVAVDNDSRTFEAPPMTTSSTTGLWSDPLEELVSPKDTRPNSANLPTPPAMPSSGSLSSSSESKSASEKSSTRQLSRHSSSSGNDGGNLGNPVANLPATTHTLTQAQKSQMVDRSTDAGETDTADEALKPETEANNRNSKSTQTASSRMTDQNTQSISPDTSNSIPNVAASTSVKSSPEQPGADKSLAGSTLMGGPVIEKPEKAQMTGLGTQMELTMPEVEKTQEDTGVQIETTAVKGKSVQNLSADTRINAESITRHPQDNGAKAEVWPLETREVFQSRVKETQMEPEVELNIVFKSVSSLGFNSVRPTLALPPFQETHMALRRQFTPLQRVFRALTLLFISASVEEKDAITALSVGRRSTRERTWAEDLARRSDTNDPPHVPAPTGEAYAIAPDLATQEAGATRATASRPAPVPVQEVNSGQTSRPWLFVVWILVFTCMAMRMHQEKVAWRKANDLHRQEVMSWRDDYWGSDVLNRVQYKVEKTFDIDRSALG